MNSKHFRFDFTNNQIEGPADYLDARGDVIIEMIDGNHAGLNAALVSRPSAGMMQVLLTMIETDYAGWLGAQQLIAGLNL